MNFLFDLIFKLLKLFKANLSDAGPDLEAELIAFCKENMSSIKSPRTIDFEEELPRHPTGKLYKRLLKDKYWP